MATGALARIDKEISEYILALSNLRGRRNTFSPVFRLPPEMLASTFIHGARDYYENSPRDATWQSQAKVPAWVNVSYVCRHWRDVALNCPTLWAYHFTASLRWTDELLVRSKQAPLMIHVFYEYKHGHYWSALMARLMEHAERFRELRLHLPARLLPTKLSLRAPHLQNLEIFVPDDSLAYPTLYSPEFFDGDTPSLRKLDLSDCGMPWHVLTLGGLTTLSLRSIPLRFQQDIADLLAILGHMQNLTVLYLSDALTSARGFLSSERSRAFTKVILPRLVRTAVSAPLSTVVAFLSCVNIPSKTETYLSFLSDHSSTEDYAIIPRLLAQRFSDISEGQTLPNLSIRSLVARFAPFALHFAFSHRENEDEVRSLPRSYEELDWDIPLAVNIDTETSLSMADRERIMSDICYSVPLTNVQRFHLIRPPFSSTFWRETFGYLSGLRYLKLSYGGMPDLASVLSLSSDTVASALEDLELFRITFSSEGGPLEPQTAITQKRLLTALSTREGLLDRLRMIQCDVVADEAESDEGEDENEDGSYAEDYSHYGFDDSDSLEEYYNFLNDD